MISFLGLKELGPTATIVGTVILSLSHATPNLRATTQCKRERWDTGTQTQYPLYNPNSLVRQSFPTFQQIAIVYVIP